MTTVAVLQRGFVSPKLAPAVRVRNRGARKADRWPSSRFTMSNSAVLFVPAARCCARVCASLRRCLHFCVRRRAHRGFGASGRRDSSDSVPPMRDDEAPTGALFLSVAPATRDHPVPGRPGPLSALHRGGFRMRTHEAGSRQWDRSLQRLPAPSRNGLAVGVRTPLRCGSRRVRGTPLRAPSFRIVSRKRPLQGRMQIDIL
jgi:hypothetical protein